MEGSLRGVVAKVLDSVIVKIEFELQSHFCIHFQTNNIGKDTNTLSPLIMG